jgi:hypothetical protein
MRTAVANRYAVGMTYRVLITGSRSWDDAETIENALIDVFKKSRCALPDITVVHGTAPGADELAGMIADWLGMTVEEHPADWERWGRRAGFLRNKEMVDAGANVCLAFWDGVSKGTEMTMKLAMKAGIDLTMYGAKKNPPA